MQRSGSPGALVVLAMLAALSGALLPLRSARAAELLIAAPSACEIGDELSFRAERALGQPLDSAAEVRCTVHIRRDGASYAARLEVQAIASPEPSRLRVFSAPSCEMLTETLALAVSLAIASGAPEPSPPRASEAAATAPEDEAPRAATADAARAAEDNPSRPVLSDDDAPGWRWGGSAALVADAGTLPGLGMGAALGASLGLDAFELRLLGTYLPPRAAEAATAASGAASAVAEIELLAGSLLACAPRLARASELTLGACAGAELGWLWGEGTGIRVERSGGAWWTAARADAEARWMLVPGLGLDVRLSALVPTERDEFAIQGIGRVFRTGAAVGRATLGVSYELGAAPR